MNLRDRYVCYYLQLRASQRILRENVPFEQFSEEFYIPNETILDTLDREFTSRLIRNRQTPTFLLYRHIMDMLFINLSTLANIPALYPENIE